jgi:hypothetical protein
MIKVSFTLIFLQNKNCYNNLFTATVNSFTGYGTVIDLRVNFSIINSNRYSTDIVNLLVTVVIRMIKLIYSKYIINFAEIC